MKRLVQNCLALAMVALAVVTAACPAHAQIYFVQDLGTLPGGGESAAFAVNDSGHVVGYAWVANEKPHAVLWKGGQIYDLDSLGGNYSKAYAINDNGTIVGMARKANGLARAFFSNGGAMTDIGTMGGSQSYAYGINMFGTIAGMSDDGGEHAFVWKSGQFTNLGSLGSGYASASAINNWGHVVGTSNIGSAQWHAFYWYSGKMHDLGTLGGTQSRANAVNNWGQVVGASRLQPSSSTEHAFLVQFDGTGKKDLGTLAGFGNSVALGINDDGVVVGASDTINGSHAFIWDAAHGMRDLNILVVANSGWVLSRAYAINDDGQIVGQGYHNGQLRAFRVFPFTIEPGWLQLLN